MVSQYRVIETKWHDASDEYAIAEYSDDRVFVKHWCWGEQGRLKIAIENATDSSIFIDLFQSFLAIDSVYHLYASDTAEFPVYYGVCDARNTEDWTKVPVAFETCKQYLQLPPGQLLIVTKFVLHPFLRETLNCEDSYGESILYEEAESPVIGAHGVGYYIGRSEVLHTADNFFYVSAKRKWIMKRPDKVYAPDNRKDNYYIRTHTLHPLGTFFMLAVVSLSIHLGTVN